MTFGTRLSRWLVWIGGVLLIGSALLVEQESGAIRRDWLDALADDLAGLHAAGTQVIVVSSGSIAVGRRHLGLTRRAIKLEESQAAAQKERARAFAAPLMKLAGQYFLDPEDLIPDEMGLYGLVDDAYLAHLFIIRLSETVEKEKGFPLLDDLKAEHAPAIRAILGNDIAEKLEAKVDVNLRSVIVRNHMAQAVMASGTLPNGAMEMWRKVEEDRARLSWSNKG